VTPGGALAIAVAGVTGKDGDGLGRLGNADLLGVIGATHRLMSSLTWVQLLSLGVFAARRPGTENQGYSRDGAKEVSLGGRGVLTADGGADDTVRTCQARLPETFKALGKGLVSGYKRCDPGRGRGRGRSGQRPGGAAGLRPPPGGPAGPGCRPAP
jgi:hypothetical protein